MMDFIMVPLTTAIVFVAIYGLFELFVRRRERLTIIEKLGEKFDPVMLKGSLDLSGLSGRKFPFGALKGGCLLMGVGIGMLVGFFIWSFALSNFQHAIPWDIGQVIALINGACIFIFGGLGLLVAFLVELKLRKSHKE